jgi:hypothetical protein
MSEEPKKDTLFTLLCDLEKADEGLLNYDPEQHKELLLKAEIKIDSCRYFYKKYESRIEEIESDIKELMAIKKTLQNRKEAFKKSMIWVLKEKALKAFPGVNYILKLTKRKNIKPLIPIPDSSTYLAFQNLITRTYKWDRDALTKAYKKDPESLKDYAIEEESESIKFSSKRNIND